MNQNNYHKKDLKHQILVLTVQQIKTEGYQAVSTRKLAKELNVSPTSIYRHFDSLDSLFGEAILLIAEEFVAYLTSTYSKELRLPATDELKIVGYHFVKYALISKNEFDFLFLSNYSLKNVSLDTHSETPLIAFMDHITQRLIKENQLKCDKQQLFNQLWCFIFGYAVLVSKNEIELNEILIESTINQLIN